MKPHDRKNEDLAADLALYALGLSETDSELAEHLKQGCPECAAAVEAHRQTAGHVGFMVRPQQPPPHLRSRVLDRIKALPQAQAWKSWSQQTAFDLLVVRQNEGEWKAVAEGVFAKQLFVDRERDAVTMLVRMEPGSTYSGHRHAAIEQCFVLEGDINDGYGTYFTGDFQCAAPGTSHGIQSTKNGCTLLIVSSLHDELID